ncbi:MAG: hypothetical protein ACTSXP_14270, partial [Promethearchaeota archaeon]
KEGYDGGIAMFEPEAHGIDTAKSLSRRTGLPMQELISIKRFLIKVLDIKETAKAIKLRWYERVGLSLFQGVKKVDNPRVRSFDSSDAERLFQLMQDHVDRNQVSVLREYDDFIWYVNHPVVNCVVHEDAGGEVDGFILAWEFLLAGFGNFMPFGWLDIVHTYHMDRKEATDMIRYFCFKAKERGWRGIQSPFIPYFDPVPFNKAGFVFYPKELIVGVFKLSEMQLPEKIESIYFDWR